MKIGITVYDDDSMKPVPLRLLSVGLMQNQQIVGAQVFPRSKVIEFNIGDTLVVNDIPNPDHPDNIKAKELEEKETSISLKLVKPTVAVFDDIEGTETIVAYFPSEGALAIPCNWYIPDKNFLDSTIGMKTVIHDCAVFAFKTSKGDTWDCLNGWRNPR